MMGSRVSSRMTTSSESALEECETLPQSPIRVNCRKNKSSSKSRIISKRIKTKHEVTTPSKNREKSVGNAVEKIENTPRRSKRRKSCDSKVQTAPTDVKQNLENGVSEIEDENLSQNLSFNLIPENVKKHLDKELFSEESDEEQNLNIKFPEAMLIEKQLDVSLKDKNEAAKVDNTIQQAVHLDDDDNKGATRKADCDMRSLLNSPPLFGEIIADNENNENEIDTEEEEIEENKTRSMINKVLLNIEDNEKYNRNNNAKFVTSGETISDPSLDQLHVDIKKADDINSFKPMNAESNCSALKQTINASNTKLYLSGNDYMDGSIYTKEDKKISEIDIEKNFDVLSEKFSESEPSTLSKNCQLITNDQQENTSYMKNKQNETRIKTSSCNDNLVPKEERDGVECNSLKNKDSNHFNVSSAKSENSNTITKPWHEHDSSAKLNNQILTKREVDAFPMKNSNSHENNDLDNSQSLKKVIKKSYIKVNDGKSLTNDIKFSEEDLETKRKKLTLLYMSALDYEKGNNQNDFAMKEKDKGRENGNLDLDAEVESIDNATFVTQKSMQSKQDLDDIPKKICDKEMKNRSELQIHQNINCNGILNEKKQLKEDNIHQNSLEMKNVMHDSQKANQITFDTTNNTQYNLKYQSPIKCGLSRNEESDKIFDSEEHSTTMQDHLNNITLSQNLSNASCNNKPDVEVVDAKNEENDKWCKTNCIYEADTTFIVTSSTGSVKLVHNENSTEIVIDRKYENTEDLKEDMPSHEDADGSFDMDDDFDLTASQMNMIEMNENNVYKIPNKSKPCTKIESCDDTHFGQDSITAEIIDQLCYIRESVDSIKELLNTFMMKDNDKK